MQDRHLREIELLGEVSRLLDHSIDLRDVAQKILDALADRLDFPHATLTLLHRNSGDILIEAAHGLSPQQASLGRYRLGEGVTGRVVQTGRAIAVLRTSDTPLFLDKTHAAGKRPDISFVCVPVRAGRTVLGALAVDRPAAPLAELEEDARLLRIVASMIGQALKLRLAVQEEQRLLSAENAALRARLEARPAPPSPLPPPATSPLSLQAQVDALERALIANALAASSGNLAAAARILRTTPRILAYKARRLGLH
ncbi:MAG: GAF domain-containing protein [Kiritimatiellae bacterium]|nr:GAF domain-containing protein [Kiritimatiellia bacterium]